MRKVVLIFFVLLSSVLSSAKIQDGMLFRSYEVPSEDRTSLVLPGGQRDWITFTDSLSLSFSLRIDLSKGRFGYICRIALDDLLPIDFLLAPHNDTPGICATADHESIIPLNEEGDNVEEWKDFYLKISEDGGNLVVTANRKEVFRGVFAAGRHRVRFKFGKCDSPGFVTSDVAPMTLADLQLKVDRGRTLVWPLSCESDLIAHDGVPIKAGNYVFLEDFNRKWTTVFSSGMPSATYACFSPDKTAVWLVSDYQICVVDLATHACRIIPYGKNMKLGLVQDSFEMLPDGTLVCADVEQGSFIRFDSAAGEWQCDNSRTRTSTLLHHNSLWLEDRGEFVQLFGYGQHKYSRTAWYWNPSCCSLTSRELKGITPRYLSAAGMLDGRIYVLGGKGNEDGRQELGVRFWDDFSEVNPADGTARTLWHNDILSRNVAAEDLVFEEGGDSFLALVYDPEIRNSALQLMRFGIDGGEAEVLADKLPYTFHDISSEARLCFSPALDVYVATICWCDQDGQYHASVHELGNPILATADASGSKSPGIPALLAVIAATAVIIAGAAFFLFRRKRRGGAGEEPVEIMGISVPRKPGVYLLGGFHVLDKDCNDIAQSFSPILVQLLSMLVLYSGDKGGISNAMLKSLLWPDKSDESFNNNKGVNIKRLRSLLEQVGNISILSEGGNWRILDEDGRCDYLVACRRLAGGNIQEILQVSSWGALLPEYHYEWLDPFKSRYTNLVFSRLDDVVNSGVQPEVVVRVADCRLLFDSLDEDAVRQKCQALMSIGKSGLAQSVFKLFTSEYKRIMQEEFSENFADFTKKTPR